MGSYWQKQGRINYFGGKKPKIERTYKGITYHSKKEAEYAAYLDTLKKAGEIKEWERQVKIDLKGLAGRKVASYYVDFKVIDKNDNIEYIEVKGFQTEAWRLKWKLFEQQVEIEEPEAKLRVVK